MSDLELRELERAAAATGGLRERMALDAEVVRRRVEPVQHPGPPTRFPTLALYLEDPTTRKPDPREEPAFRRLLAEAGEWETLVVWLVVHARETGPRLVGWSARARHVAAAVDSLTWDWPGEARRQAFRDAYPWGERRGWPYKAWRYAVAKVQGRKLAPDRRGRRSAAPAPEPTRELFA